MRPFQSGFIIKIVLLGILTKPPSLMASHLKADCLSILIDSNSSVKQSLPQGITRNYYCLLSKPNKLTCLGPVHATGKSSSAYYVYHFYYNPTLSYYGIKALKTQQRFCFKTSIKNTFYWHALAGNKYDKTISSLLFGSSVTTLQQSRS